MTRLKYYRIGDKLYTDWLTVGPNFVVRGIINTKLNIYQVIEFNTSEVSKGEGNSLRQVKDKLKSNLVSIGVNFEGEIRRKE